MSERCQAGDESRLVCDILRDLGKKTIQVGSTISASAIAFEVADFHW